jgi:hypothetical protein
MLSIANDIMVTIDIIFSPLTPAAGCDNRTFTAALGIALARGQRAMM